jgi:hypothetical protein
MWHERIEKQIVGRMVNSEEEACLLAKYTGLEGDHLEIGCLWGGTAILAALSKIDNGVKGHIYTVDLMEGGWWDTGDPELKLKPTLETVQQNLEQLGLENRVSIIVGNSSPLTIPEGVKPVTVYIDGDHSEKGCLTDWENVKKLMPDYVLFHDCTHKYGTNKVIDIILQSEPEWEPIEQAGSVIVFKRVSNEATA